MFRRAFAAAFAVLFAARLLAAEPTLVGGYGDLSKLEIRGAKTFAPEAIRAALATNFDLRLKAHPFRPIGYFLDELQEQVVAGYRHAGFPDAEVIADLSDGKVVLTVAEGRRYRTGAIRVLGAKAFPVEQLVVRLTEPYPPKDAIPQSFTERDGERQTRWVDLNGKEATLQPAVWSRDAWAKFPVAQRRVLPPLNGEGRRPAPVKRAGNDSAVPFSYKERAASFFPSTFHEPISHALSDLGYHFPEFLVRAVPDGTTGKAELVIELEDAGPTAEIGSIEVAGNRRDSREEVLDFLTLRPGNPLTRQRLVALQQRLWASGRYLRSDVKPIRPANRGDKLVLRIDLVEYTKAPKLDTTLAHADQVLLRCRDWLSNRQNWSGDLVWTYRNAQGEVRAIVAKQAGVFVAVRETASAKQEPRVHHTILSSAEETILVAHARNGVLRGVRPPGAVLASFNFHLDEDPKADKPFTFGFGLGFSSASSGKDSPFVVAFTLQPAVFLALSHQEDAAVKVADGVLTIDTKKNGIWRVAADSGELLDIAYENRDGEAPGGEAVGRVSFEKGAFQHAAAAIRQHAAQYENQFDIERPLTSLLGFLCDEPLVAKTVNNSFQDVRPLRTFDRLLGLGAFQPVDELLRASKGDEADSFSIPVIPGPELLIGRKDLYAGAMVALQYGDRLVPHGSWCWSVMNEAAMVIVGHQEHTGQVLAQLCDGDTGPLCLATVATVLQRVNGQMAATVAGRGLERLSLDRFRKDCRPLLDEKYLVGQCLRRAATIFRNLSDDDLRLLAEGVEGEYHKYLAACDKALRGDRNRPIGMALDDMLEALWKAGLKSELETLLNRLRAPAGSEAL